MEREIKGSEELRSKLRRGDIAEISKATKYSWTHCRKVILGIYPANYTILGMAYAMAAENEKTKKRMLRHASKIAELANN